MSDRPFQSFKRAIHFAPHRMASDEADMLRTMGLRSVEDLFSDIPAAVRSKGLALPHGLSEQEVVSRITEMLSSNRTMAEMPTFLGAGLYDHLHFRECGADPSLPGAPPGAGQNPRIHPRAS